MKEIINNIDINLANILCKHSFKILQEYDNHSRRYFFRIFKTHEFTEASSILLWDFNVWYLVFGLRRLSYKIGNDNDVYNSLIDSLIEYDIRVCPSHIDKLEPLMSKLLKKKLAPNLKGRRFDL